MDLRLTTGLGKRQSVLPRVATPGYASAELAAAQPAAAWMDLYQPGVVALVLAQWREPEGCWIAASSLLAVGRVMAALIPPFQARHRTPDQRRIPPGGSARRPCLERFNSCDAREQTGRAQGPTATVFWCPRRQRHSPAQTDHCPTQPAKRPRPTPSPQLRCPPVLARISRQQNKRSCEGPSGPWW